MGTAVEPARSVGAGGRESSLPYVVPFVAFLGFLAVADYLTFLGAWEFPLRVVLLAVILFVFSRRVIDLRVAQPVASIGLGVAVFLIWIGPDILFPGYREHWLFQNSITGHITTSIPSSLRSNWLVLAFRSIRATVLVPIIEELFWRAWLLRWLIDRDFWKVPLGTYATGAFWIASVLFASEHGPYWEVGLIAGVLYNWWIIRTRSLGDCILAHAVTNGCICVYAIAGQKWQYWM